MQYTYKIGGKRIKERKVGIVIHEIKLKIESIIKLKLLLNLTYIKYEEQSNKHKKKILHSGCQGLKRMWIWGVVFNGSRGSVLNETMDNSIWVLMLAQQCCLLTLKHMFKNSDIKFHVTNNLHINFKINKCSEI